MRVYCMIDEGDVGNKYYGDYCCGSLLYGMLRDVDDDAGAMEYSGSSAAPVVACCSTGC